MTHLLGHCHAIHSPTTQSFVDSHSWLYYSTTCHYSSLSKTLDPFVVIFPLYIIAPIFHSSLLPDDSKLLFTLLIGWLVNCHMSWPLEVYRVAMIVRFTPQLCNLRTLLHPSQSSVLLQTSWSSISRAPSIWFALLHSHLFLKSSITLLEIAPSPAWPRIAFIALSMRSVEDIQWKLDP